MNILLRLKVTIDPSLAEPVGFTGLPDGDSTPPDVAGALAGEITPPSVAGARAGESTELAGELAITLSAGPGDEWDALGAAA